MGAPPFTFIVKGGTRWTHTHAFSCFHSFRRKTARPCNPAVLLFERTKINRMTAGLIRRHGQGDFHFITCSCYRRLRFLESPASRNNFLEVLEDVRRRYNFVVIGYVVMPEHFHLQIGEPEVADPSVVIQVLKQRVSRRCRENQVLRYPAFWTKRYYDFNIFSQKKNLEKLYYIHHNPVRRGLVTSPELWMWSSARHYGYGEKGPVTIGV